MAFVTSLNDALKSVPPFGMEVLTAAELDAVAGGFDSESGIGPADSNTISMVSTDGNDEPGHG
jgi:hypothetical protein